MGRQTYVPSLRPVLGVALGLLAMLLPTCAKACDLIESQKAARFETFLASTSPLQRVEGYKLSPEEYARAVAYSREGYWLYFVTTAYTLLVLGSLLRFRIGPRIRDWAERVSRRRWLQLLLFGPTLLLIFSLLLLPTDVWDQWRSRRYGLSIQSWPSWFGDCAATQIAAIILGTVVIGLFYHTIRRSPRRWWLWLWAILVPLIVLFVLVQPVVIDPLFETFEPLSKSHPDLVDSIEVLLDRAGLVIPPQHIYLLKVGDKSTEVDASSEGFGPTKRIFVTDTIIASEPRAALLHTVGHEIGHFMFTLDWIVFAICVPLSLAVLYLIDRILGWSLARWGAKWRIRGSDDWASLPVLALIVSVIAVVLTPAANTLSRYREHEADRHGLDLAYGIVPNVGEAAAQAFQKDGAINLSDPVAPAFIEWWLFDHPPVNDRIIFCRTYQPGQKRSEHESGK